MNEKNLTIGAVGLAGLVIVGVLAWVWIKGPKAAAAAVVNAAGNAAAGAVEGIGEQIGIPRTDVDKCALAMKDGRTFDASIACPAPTFLRWIMAGRPQSLAANLVETKDKLDPEIYGQVGGP